MTTEKLNLTLTKLKASPVPMLRDQDLFTSVNEDAETSSA